MNVGDGKFVPPRQGKCLDFAPGHSQRTHPLKHFLLKTAVQFSLCSIDCSLMGTCTSKLLDPFVCEICSRTFHVFVWTCCVNVCFHVLFDELVEFV